MRRATTFGAVLLSSTLAFGQATAPAPAGASSATSSVRTESEETVILSPFEVTAQTDTGYQATETLAGTRIRTDLRDVGSAISVLTKEFLSDIGATDNSTLLQYTTNAEVAGTRGTYAGLGNGTSVDENGTIRSPGGQAQRVRGLAAADNTRDFYITDIPWDSYNVDRIDIQRGPNSILFGLGSPAGIINASTRNAGFTTAGEVQARVGSYGSWRGSLDYNHVLIDNMLSFRFDALVDHEQFQQEPTFENDERLYGAIRFDPNWFKGLNGRTSIKVRYEHGEIDANRPRTVPPEDRVTPWFRPVDNTSLNGGMGKFSVLNGYQIGSAGNTFNPWIAGYANQQQPIWFIDGASNQLYRIYGGYVNTGSLNNSGVAQGAAASAVGMRYADAFSALNSLSGFATNARLPGFQYGQYRNATLQDDTVFDFYNNLLDGPTAMQWENWDASNFDLTQTLWDDRVGVQLSYDRQKYDRGGQTLINNALNIDLLQNFQDYVIGPNNTPNTNRVNPNYARPYVPAGAGGGSSYESDRKYLRASLFGEVRSTDFFDKDSFLGKLLGKHRFNGVYSNEEAHTEDKRWQMYANSLAYATFKTQGNPDGISNLAPVGVIYVGPSLANATSASNGGITRITSNVDYQDGNIYQFDWTWRPQAGVVYNANWDVPAALRDTRPAGSTLPSPIPIFVGIPGTDANGTPTTTQLLQVSNPANYVGWNSNFHNELLRYNLGEDETLLTSASKTLRETTSYAGTWQGFLWNEAIVPIFGWRYDEVKTKSVSASPVASNRNALNLNPSVYRLPDAFPSDAILKAHSTSGGVVVHLNRFFGDRDPLPINVSLSYSTSSNFQVGNVRRNIYGAAIPNPAGDTKDYGVVLSTKDGKYSFRAMKYESEYSQTSTQLDITGLTNTIKNAMNWRNIKTYYMSLYNWASAGQTDTRHFAGLRWMWDPAYVNAAGRPVRTGNPNTTPEQVPIPAGATLETQAQADARRDASLQAINNFQAWLTDRGYFEAWNYGVGPTQLAGLQTRGEYEANPSPVTSTTAFQNSIFDYRPLPGLSGFAVTADTRSEGYEFEFTANPLRNWRIAFNASQTKAVRSNVGGPELDELVTTIDELMAGPGGDLVMFNSDWSAGNEMRTQGGWNGWRGQYTLLKLQEDTAASELREWRYNIVTNYTFTSGWLNNVGVGGSYRWQDKVVIGYPVVPGAGGLASFDLDSPYYGPSEGAIDLWASYQRKLTEKVTWKVQLNVRNAFDKEGLIPISVQPDGQTWASLRVKPIQEWVLTNTFSF